jgi:antitoxin PrlF
MIFHDLPLKNTVCITAIPYYSNTWTQEIKSNWSNKMEPAITSKLTTKSQATIPRKIRDVLGLTPGDSVAFEVGENKKVVIRKATPIDFEFAHALEGTLSEWLSKNDEEAYLDL